METTPAREIRYEDLALLVEPAEPGSFRVNAINTPYGLTAAPFALPFDREQLETMIATVRSSVLQSQGRNASRDFHIHRPQSAPGESLTETGSRLFHALFQKNVREVYLLSRGRSESTPDQGMRIRLVLPIDTPDSTLLQTLPWELLHCEESRDFLARSVLTPVVRQLVIPWASSSLAKDPPERLRILIAIAAPRGTDPLDTADEQGRILQAWCEREQVEVDLLPSATLTRLRETVRSRHYHVFHFIGHGTFQNGEGALLFETSDGGEHPVSGTLLAETLRESRELRLAFLNACETGIMGSRPGEDPMLGAAAALIRRGLPAVIANQFPISDSAARTFSEAVYRSLARGSSLDAAVGDGRFAIYQEDTSSWEWITPVLFTAQSSSDVFRPIVKRQASPQDRLSEASRLLADKSYEPARKLIESARTGGKEPADLHYYLALALLQGKRPRSLKPDEIKSVMASAGRSLNLPDCAAHHFGLLAFLCKDFYLENQLIPPEPGYDALLRMATQAPLRREKLDELVLLAPWSKPVVDTILDRIKKGAP